MAGLGGFVLGGALKGVGAGLQQKVEEDVLARREARLEALRQQERAEDRAARKEDLQFQDDANARGDVRRANLGMASDNNRFANEAQLGAAAAAAQKAEREDRQAFEVSLTQLRQGFEASEASKTRAWEAQQELGKPIGQTTDEKTGEPVLMFRDPNAKSGVRTVRITGVDERKPDKAAESGSSLLGNRTGGTAAPAQPAQTVTKADVEFSARKYGMTYEEAKRKAESMGMKVVG